MDKKMSANLGAFIGAIIGIFLGGMFIFFVWRAIALEFNLPVFSYWICVCAYGALRSICHALGKIFSGIGNKKEEGE